MPQKLLCDWGGIRFRLVCENCSTVTGMEHWAWYSHLKPLIMAVLGGTLSELSGTYISSPLVIILYATCKLSLSASSHYFSFHRRDSLHHWQNLTFESVCLCISYILKYGLLGMSSTSDHHIEKEVTFPCVGWRVCWLAGWPAAREDMRGEWQTHSIVSRNVRERCSYVLTSLYISLSLFFSFSMFSSMNLTGGAKPMCNWCFSLFLARRQTSRLSGRASTTHRPFPRAVDCVYGKLRGCAFWWRSAYKGLCGPSWTCDGEWWMSIVLILTI